MFLRSMSPATHTTDSVDASHLTEHDEIHDSPGHVKITKLRKCRGALILWAIYKKPHYNTTYHVTVMVPSGIHKGQNVAQWCSKPSIFVELW